LVLGQAGFRYWRIASFRGNAPFWPLSEQGGTSGFTSIRVKLKTAAAKQRKGAAMAAPLLPVVSAAEATP
jgi:hypothetical protein